jgi:hypothetical protein
VASWLGTSGAWEPLKKKRETATKEERASACKRVMRYAGMVQIDIRRNNP